MTKRRLPPKAVAATLQGDSIALRAAAAARANVNEADSDGRTALHHAAIDGNVEAATLLLAAGADVDAADTDGWTALHFAASGHHFVLAKLLLETGAGVDSEDIHGNTPLFRAVFESRGRGEIIGLLRQYGADASHKNRRGVSPADLAATIANFDVKQWFQ